MVRLLSFGVILFAILQSCSNSSAQKENTTTNSNRFAVVELFTSEGCSSCPPADDLANMIQEDAEKNGKNVFVLCEHVDYWNRLGWKDPFSKKFFSDRQKWYSGFLKDDGIYTPQIVVNGTTSFIGSDKQKADEAINTALSSPTQNNNTIQLSTKDFTSGNFSYSISEVKDNDALNLVLVERSLTSNVLRGENKGRTLHHTNIVRDWITVEHPEKNGTVQFKTDSLKINKDKYQVVVFMQNPANGQINAATSLK